MSNPYFTYSSPLVAGQTARSGQVNSTETAQQTGFDLVYADVLSAVRVVSAAVHSDAFEVVANAAARANKAIGFDSNGNGVLLNVTFNARGAWVTATAYVYGDTVTAGVEQSLYACVQAHTSGVFATDYGAGKWVKLIDNTAAYQASYNPKIVTAAASPYAASPGDDLLVDVTAGPVTITLPSSPTLATKPVGITHIDGSITTNPITVGRNGQNIMGLAQDMTVNTTNASLVLGFSDSTRGWRLVRGV